MLAGGHTHTVHTYICTPRKSGVLHAYGYICIFVICVDLSKDDGPAANWSTFARGLPTAVLLCRMIFPQKGELRRGPLPRKQTLWSSRTTACGSAVCWGSKWEGVGVSHTGRGGSTLFGLNLEMHSTRTIVECRGTPYLPCQGFDAHTPPDRTQQLP